MKLISYSLLALLMFAAPLSAEKLDDIRALWMGQRYEQCIDELIDYRDQPFGRNVEVDYMLGTSLCRGEQDHDLGRAFLENTLRVYVLSDENRRVIKEELEGCPVRKDPEQLAFLSNRGSAGGSGVRGKMFRLASEVDQAIGVDPLETIRVIPSEELRGRLVPLGSRNPDYRVRGWLQALEGFEGMRCRVHVSEHFILAGQGRQDEVQLAQIARELEQALAHFQNAFGIPAPEHYIQVYILPDFRTLRRLASGLHGLQLGYGTIGYSVRDDLSISAVVHGASVGTLKHELTHLMLRRHFGDSPPWLDEGLAALYEVSRQEGGRLVGLANWRGDVLRMHWRRTDIRVNDILSMNWKQFDAVDGDIMDQGVQHALARYIALFLQEKNQLDQVYRVYRKRDIRAISRDPQADAALLIKKATGMNPRDLERAFRIWMEDFNREITNKEIKALQIGLIALGYDPGKPDGLFGKNTIRAVKAFQRDQGWHPDGIVDRGMLRLIQNSREIQ